MAQKATTGTPPAAAQSPIRMNPDTTPLPPVAPGLHRARDAWLSRFRAAGKSGATANKAPRFDATTLEKAVGTVCAIPNPDNAIARLIAAYGIDGEFYAALRELGDSLAAARQPLPPDLRHFEQLTPPEREVLAQAQERIRSARDMVLDAARSDERVEELPLLGRGAPVGKTIASIRDSIQTFLAAAPSRKELLADAGVTDAKLQRLAAFLPQLRTMEISIEARMVGKSGSTQAVVAASLAIESAFQLFSARVKAALEDDPLMKRVTLERLPRAPDRRRTRQAAPGKVAEGGGAGNGGKGGATAPPPKRGDGK
jgi:hypothetical protein